MPLVTVLAEMEMRGVLIDVPFLKRLGEILSQRMKELEETVYRLVGNVSI
jgi:DNA polymerase-1